MLGVAGVLFNAPKDLGGQVGHELLFPISGDLDVIIPIKKRGN